MVAYDAHVVDRPGEEDTLTRLVAHSRSHVSRNNLRQRALREAAILKNYRFVPNRPPGRKQPHLPRVGSY